MSKNKRQSNQSNKLDRTIGRRISSNAKKASQKNARFEMVKQILSLLDELVKLLSAIATVFGLTK